jgi:hypothetical protein
MLVILALPSALPLVRATVFWDGVNQGWGKLPFVVPSNQQMLVDISEDPEICNVTTTSSISLHTLSSPQPEK